MQSTLDDIPCHDVILLLGNFNVKFGKCIVHGKKSWQTLIGQRRVENREEVLELCASNDMHIMNTKLIVL